MLSEKEIMDKLYELPEHFNQYMKNKEYVQAKRCYDKAVTLTVFLDVRPEVKIDLFGNQPYKEDWEEEKDGLFRKADVLKASADYLKHLKAEVQEIEERRATLGPRVIYRAIEMTKK